MTKLLNTTFTTIPKAKVFLSGVTYINATRCANYSQAPWVPPNCPTNMQLWIVDLNAKLPNVVSSFVNAGFYVKFHDPNPGCNFVAEDYWTWGIHFIETIVVM